MAKAIHRLRLCIMDHLLGTACMDLHFINKPTQFKKKTVAVFRRKHKFWNTNKYIWIQGLYKGISSYTKFYRKQLVESHTVLLSLMASHPVESKCKVLYTFLVGLNLDEGNIKEVSLKFGWICKALKPLSYIHTQFFHVRQKTLIKFMIKCLRTAWVAYVG